MAENEMLMERFGLAMERIGLLQEEQKGRDGVHDFFFRTAQFICDMAKLKQLLESGEIYKDLELLSQWNQKIYADITGDAYEKSYANPSYAVSQLGEEGKIYCALYAQVRNIIEYTHEENLEGFVITLELFLEIYHLFLEEASTEEIRQAMYWFYSDYSEFFTEEQVKGMVSISEPFDGSYRSIIESQSSGDYCYLYRYGLYISDTELQMAKFLDTLPEEEIQKAAETFVEGYIRGFKNAGKDLSAKDRYQMRYAVGCERIIKAGIRLLEEKGLYPIIKRNTITSSSPNQQYAYDHRFDQALYLDRQYKERRLQALKQAFEKYQKEAFAYAGPILVEAYGEPPFAPVSKDEAWKLTQKQQKIQLEWTQAMSQYTQKYLKPETTSFCIISYPTPKIGANFEEIFKETVKVNTLDYALYEAIQKKLIDALDEGEKVHITGKDGNETDLMIALHELADKSTQTNFENCLADVNIPLGEVFTSPKLKGTNGVLHVSKVFLHGIEYRNLKVTLTDGMISDYTCTNFDKEEENRAFLKENLLFHHDTLPIGEFAIGTNTTAYRMAVKYDIFDRLTILIAEKTGPHFAMGDTCYSHSEEIRVYNPDGKEIIAKDNECSILRKTDPQKAYYSCHTDITIPYEELGEITVLRGDGSEIPLIQGGKFVLSGTEKLNEPLEDL